MIKKSMALIVSYGFMVAFYMALYMPLIVLFFLSFNSNTLSLKWHAFTWQWYKQLFLSQELWRSFLNSCIVAIATVMLSTSLGLCLVFYGSWMRKYVPLFYLNIMIPEIVLAVGLLSFFVKLWVPLGYCTLILAHTVLGLGYVVPMLQSQFEEINPAILEASLDLGASLSQTFLKVVIPLLKPTLYSAALLVFIVSFDDFLLAFFCAGSVQTLSLYIFAMIRSGLSPIINALSVFLIFFTVLIAFILSFFKLDKKFLGEK